MNNCSVENCVSLAKHRGLCGKHYKRQWRHGDVSVSLINMSGIKDKCAAKDCVRDVRMPSTGLCQKHHIRFVRYGRLESTKAEYGAGTINAGGYRVISIAGKPTYEHISIAEKALGKKLPSGAVVHHMNKQRADNHTPYNLVICQDQSYHLLLHRRMREYELYGKCSNEL